jgi:hypothetical protein
MKECPEAAASSKQAAGIALGQYGAFGRDRRRELLRARRPAQVMDRTARPRIAQERYGLRYQRG